MSIPQNQGVTVYQYGDALKMSRWEERQTERRGSSPATLPVIAVCGKNGFERRGFAN